MRGGKLFIKGSVGYRVGIHMKSFGEQVPVIVVGGKAADFLGEYMAGGILIILGLESNGKESIVGNFVGTGMHGGAIYIRDSVEDFQLGKEVGKVPLTEADQANLSSLLTEFSADFNLNTAEILSKEFVKLVPLYHRPYGNLYTH